MLSKTAFDKLDQLPALSPATPKLIELANDPTSTPNQLMTIIKTDPVLTSKIIGLINSSYFSLTDRISSLNRAIILLGFNTIKNIALSTSLITAISSNGEGFSFKLSELWKHMVAVAITSRYIAKKMSPEISKKAEHYYIAGLLHDMGDVLLLRYYPKEYQELCIIAKKEKLTISEVSMKKFNITPSRIGAEASRKWKFPQEISEVIEFSRTPVPECSDITKTIHIVDKFCRKNNFGFACEKVDVDITDEDLTLININRDELENLVEIIEVELEKASAFIQ
jgi:HD-like signal output (HDOD) protein